MTDHCYIAVKGSLHSTDSSVFGLTTEEIIALSKRFSDTCKEVINGVLIKGSPTQVINALAELGYRVICSSGETEIVWTLRREVLVPEKFNDRDERFERIALSKITSVGSPLLPRKTISGNIRKPNASPRKSDPGENLRDRSQAPQDVKTVDKKKIERLGSKPEDRAQYGNVKGSKIDVRDIESVDESSPPPDIKVIINTNLSSEFNPLSFKNVEPSKPNDFVSTYTETIAKPAEMTAKPAKGVGVSCDMYCQPICPSPHGENRRQINATPGARSEYVVAEYTAESVMLGAQPYMRPRPSNIDRPCNVCPQNTDKIQTGMKQSTHQNQRIRNFSPTLQQNIPRRKTIEKLGTKPEDLAQYGLKNRKVEVIDIDDFQEMPEEQADEKLIILNTNKSSEANPLSNRNLEEQEDLLARYPGTSRRK